MGLNVITPNDANMTITAASTLYTPSKTELRQLMAWMNDSSIASLLQRFYVSPMDSIVSLKVYPFDIILTDVGGVQNRPFVLADATVTYTVGTTTHNVMTWLVEHYYRTLDLGEYQFPAASSWTDMSPYTTYELYLPYIGYKTIDPNDFWGRKLKIKYVVELATGATTVYITSSALDDTGERVVDMASGILGVDIPIAGQDANVQMENALSTFSHIASGAIGITGGAVAGNAGSVVSGASTVVGGMSGRDYTIRKGGFSSGLSKWCGPQTCHMKVSKTRFYQPATYAHDFGLPYGAGADLSTLTGYTKASAVHVEGAGFAQATDDEKAEIERLLLSGVIL